jgi:hypothetical protein
MDRTVSSDVCSDNDNVVGRILETSNRCYELNAS